MEVSTMPTPVRRVTALLAAMLLAISLAATAVAGGHPAGQGLTTTADHGITNLSCTDPTITDVVLTRGGGVATWTLDGRFFVLQSLEISGTVTTPEGSFPVSFGKTWGNRTGLQGEHVMCTFTQSFTDDGATFTGTGTVHLVRVR
jgi:hypothetical protein